MAQIWMKCNPGSWGYYELDGEAYSLSSLPPRAQPRGAARAAVELVKGSAGWVLLCSDAGGARVNGLPVAGGLSALEDRDELRVDAGTAFFSTERVLEVVALPHREAEAICPRCRARVDEGTPAVVCTCGIAFHQDDSRACYTYGDTCPSCKRSTDLDVGFRWTPEDR